MDVFAVREAAARAVAKCRKGEGPVLLEMKTYRYRGHSMSDPAKYRSKEEVSKMRAEFDPIDQVKNRILEGKIMSEGDLKAIDKEIKAVVSEAADFAQTSTEPDPSELYTDVLVAE
jgi:pyruvate dehydrogenase E1 component alpha subunit